MSKTTISVEKHQTKVFNKQKAGKAQKWLLSGYISGQWVDIVENLLEV
jgi:hypothetical protein